MCKVTWLILYVMHTFRVIIHPDRQISAQPLVMQCNVSIWNVDLFIPNIITSYCTTLFITTLFNYTCVIALLDDVIPARSSWKKVRELSWSRPGLVHEVQYGPPLTQRTDNRQMDKARIFRES